MGVIGARDLKENTADFIRRLRAGERFVLTYRGRRIGVITPATEERREALSGDADAWAEVNAALESSQPPFSDWQEATAWIRGRSS